MARSEFRFNKRRKHFAYLFKDIGSLRMNIILSTKPIRRHNGKIHKNIELYRHPFKKLNMRVYVIPIIYIDPIWAFDRKLKWSFDRNDKRKIKRIIKHKKYKKSRR